VPVYWIYVTAWSNDGLVQFRDDIYQRDGFGAGAVTASASSSSEAYEGGLLEPMSLSEVPRR
jgi:murein L,D-transpeptidase YcbB/YkuD